MFNEIHYRTTTARNFNFNFYNVICIFELLHFVLEKFGGRFWWGILLQNSVNCASSGYQELLSRFQIDFFAFEHGIPSQWLFQISNRRFSSQKSFQLGSFMYFYGIRYGLKLLHFKSHIRIVIFQQFTLFCG